MADVSDPRIAEAVQLVRDDNSPENWATFGYEGKTKIVVDGTGSGGHAELMDHLPDDSAKFALLRLDDGDRESKRVKFVFLTFTGDHAPQLVKARLATHTSSIKPLLGLCHTDFRADNARECTEALIRKKLKAAAGADYDSGSNASGYQSSGNIKERALKAYQQKEKEGNIKSVIYVTSALPNTTPVDLSNRPTVAPPTEAKKNIRDNVNDIKKFEGTGTSTIKKKAGAEFEEKKAGTKSATATPSPAAKPGTRPSVSIKPSIDVIGSSGSSSSTTDAADDAPASPKKPVAARKPTPAANKPEIKKKPEPSTLSPAPEGSEFRERIGSILNEDLPDDEEERARIRAEKRRSQRADIEQKAKDEVSQLTQQLLSKPVSPKPARKEEPEEEEQQQEEEEEKENDDEEEERAKEKAEKEKKEKAEKEKKEKAEKEKKEKAEKEAKEKKEKEAKEKAEKEKKEKAEKEKKEKAEKEKKEKEAKEKAEKDAKKKSSLFDDDDDEEDLFSKPTKPAPKKAENLFDSMDKQLEEEEPEVKNEEEKKEEEEEEKPAEVDHRTVTVPYVMLTMLLIKHDILSSDFDGTPEELVQFIENAVENM